MRPGEIIDILAAIPDEVEALILPLDEALLRHKPSPEEWCAAEILGHMLETDKLFASRVRVLLEEQGANLPSPMPPWKLHEGKGYDTMPVADIAAALRAARSDTLALVRNLTPETWVRVGYTYGAPRSILDLGVWLANHDRGHLAQVRRLCVMG